MKKEMKLWQWLTATLVSALTMAGGLYTFADQFVESRVEQKLEKPLLMIDTVDKRLDRIEDKLDRVIQGGK